MSYYLWYRKYVIILRYGIFTLLGENTGFAILDLADAKTKTAIGHHYLVPDMAIVDPITLNHLPPLVVACSGFDVLSHAIESYTARPYYRRYDEPSCS